ncbi:MAG: hypothetical protein VX757_00975, partial [Planctomycetota bacterium]|nr:hypothetical protein [Planctomycetota bacterium]
QWTSNRNSLRHHASIRQTRSWDCGAATASPRQRLTTAKGHAAERLPRHRDTSAVGSHFLENGETLCPPESPK